MHNTDRDMKIQDMIEVDANETRLTIPKEEVVDGEEYLNKAFECDEVEGGFAQERDTIKTLPEVKQLQRASTSKSYIIPLQRLSAQISGFTLRSIYASTVSIPAIYTEHKHEQYGTLKNFLRKASGIPFAILYGFFLVWIISDVIIGKAQVPDRSYSFSHFDVAMNICDTMIKQKNVTINATVSNSGLYDYDYESKNVVRNVTIGKNLNSSQHRNSNFSTPPHNWSSNINPTRSTSNATDQGKQPILFENDSVDLYTITGSVMAVVGLSSVFSRNTRATMLLILPGLITRHSRNLIFTIVLGIMVHEGPVDNLRTNFYKVIHNAACIYRTIVAIGCAEQENFKKEMEEARTVYRSLLRANEILEEARCRYDPNNCVKTKYPDLPQPNIAQMLSKLVLPSTRSMKEQSKIVVENVARLGYYADIGRKVVTVLSIFMLIFDAIRYLRDYYTDSSFDNMYVGRTTRKQWKDKRYYSKSQEYQQYKTAAWNDDQNLRRWELNQGFTTSNLPKFTRAELWKVVRRSLTTVLFSMFVVLALSADHLLASALQYVKDNYNFTVSLGEEGRNISARFHLHMEDIDYTTGTCLVAPTYTNTRVYWIITGFLLGAAASCFSEVYMSRIRAKLCNIFYPDRAEERADFLYFKIISGRINRRINLLLHLRREEEKRRRLFRFSPWQRFIGLFLRVKVLKNRGFTCSGCGWMVKSRKKKHSRQLSFVVDEKRQTTTICENCQLDLSNNDLHYTEFDGNVVKEEEGCF